jgi:2-deoxy-D-gluconate 3-dehydrogenase
MSRFANKVAIVTGAGRGLGQTYAMKFAAEGAHVVGVDVGDLTETGSKIKSAGGKYTPITSDLSKLNQKAAADLIAEAVKSAGGADILVNNAGIIRRAPAVDHPEMDWSLAIQINLTAPFFLCQAIAKQWITVGRAKAPADARLKIVNIASMLSFQGGILVPGYTASKSGIAGITKALANEWAKERINVNAVAPGYVITENTRPIREDPAREASILARIPEGHWATTDEIAPGVLWLASKDADYCNGTIMNIDGGWLAR